MLRRQRPDVLPGRHVHHRPERRAARLRARTSDSTIEPVEVFISEAQFEYWKYTHLTIDVVPGRGAGFSVEGPTGMRFLIRSRMLDDAELDHFGLGPVS